jgi:hypothetical protein
MTSDEVHILSASVSWIIKKRQQAEHLPQETVNFAGYQWLMPIIPATQEAEIRRIMVQSQPGQIV